MTASSASFPFPTGARSRAVLEIAVIVLIVALVAAGQTRPVIAAGMLVYGLIALASPRLAAGLFLAFLVFIPAGRYGLVFSGAPSDWDLYWLGVNELNVSAVEVLLGILFLATVLRRTTESFRAPATGFPVTATIAFAAVYGIQVALAVARGNGLGAALNFYGGRLVFDALLTALLVTWIVDDQGEPATQLLVGLIAVRAAYGLARYAFFGGDPLNYYANFQHINVTISFWEVADGALMAFGALYALGKLVRADGVNALEIPGWLALAGLTSADIALTHRRSTVLGFVLAVFVFFLLEGLWRRPKWLLLPGGAAVVGFVGLLQRFHARSLVGVLTAEVLTSSDQAGGRVLESASALATILQHPLLGVGPNGSYQPLPGFHPFAPTTLVHSGILHLWLKLGLPGVLTGAWILGTLLWRGLRARHHKVAGADRLLLHATLGSFVIWLVDMAIGTPLIEVRTMIAIGLWLGLLLLGSRSATLLPHATSC